MVTVTKRPQVGFAEEWTSQSNSQLNVSTFCRIYLMVAVTYSAQVELRSGRV